ncbi:VOC family protein [Planctomycetota bacterium]
MTIEVDGIDHIYLAVSDMARSESFYDRLMSSLNFRKSKGPLATGDVHIHYFNQVTQLSLRPSKTKITHNPSAPGLHHLCLRVPDSVSVDSVYARISNLGLQPSQPQVYPEYAQDYYAIDLTDPDGIRIEITNHRKERKDIVQRWSEYEEIMVQNED